MIGMLWYNNDKQTDLVTKIQQAADYYLNKYGLVANRCVVHPSMAPGDLDIPGIKVDTNKGVLPNHFWVGIDREAQNGRVD